MKNMLNGMMATLLLGSILAVGCGGTDSEPSADAPPAPETSDSSSDKQDSIAEDVQLPGMEMEAPGQVEALTAYCYVWCNDGWVWGNYRFGPFKNVTWGNCANYGRYYCSNKGWKYDRVEWK